MIIIILRTFCSSCDNSTQSMRLRPCRRTDTRHAQETPCTMQENTVNHANTTTMSTVHKSGGTPCTMQEETTAPTGRPTCAKQEEYRVPIKGNRAPSRRELPHHAGGSTRTMQEIATTQEKVLNMRGKSALRTSPNTNRLGIHHFQPSSLTRVYGYVVQCRAGYLGGFVP